MTATVRASQISFNEGAIRLAIQHEREVVFDYPSVKLSGGLAQREIAPTSIKTVTGGYQVVVGRDLNEIDESIKSFRVDRIREGSVTFA